MGLITGKVVDGKIVVEDGALEEGASVTILTHDEATFELTDEQVAALAASRDETRNGQSTCGNDLLTRLRQD